MNYLGREEAGLGALVGQWSQSLLSQAAMSHVFPGVQPSPPTPSFVSASSAAPARLQLKHSPPVIRKFLLISGLKLFVAG